MSNPGSVLLLHDAGELDDVAALLRGLGLPFEEQRGAAAAGPVRLPRDLLVATALRAIALPKPPAEAARPGGPARIAVVPSDSAGLRSGLVDSGFELLVRRPVHPTALRLLILRCLYRGPERRQQPRVAVGAHIRFRRNLLWRRAMLSELSAGGCRLLAPRIVPTGRRVLLELPDPGAPDSPLRINARVVRANAVSPTDPTFALALAFVAPGDAVRERLDGILAAHARGPASLPDGWALEEPLPTPGEPSAVVAAAPPLNDAAAEERRRGARAPYPTRIVTLGEEAAQVVMGRDLSLGGIRVEPHGGLECGQKVALALHGEPLPVPVVVRGSVARDDGPFGLVIRFDPLAPVQQGALEKLMEGLGSIEILERDASAHGSVVTRILSSEESTDPA